jgi:hypothetical protein
MKLAIGDTVMLVAQVVVFSLGTVAFGVASGAFFAIRRKFPASANLALAILCAGLNIASVIYSKA